MEDWIVGMWTIGNNGAMAAIVSATVVVGRPRASNKPSTMVLDNLRISKQRLGRRRVENGRIKETNIH